MVLRSNYLVLLIQPLNEMRQPEVVVPLDFAMPGS
ncbi:hypothetical protein Cflav_PD0300 [Pedosphaera parvula Ellin514]|uniref:Uncharacterized protein n=1 Tax=Pedosphaera parvula (strain Ellin514) TaxID=320771 RepID=B9XSF3_PEDPL|nr:hypothetical protein Cflav_PD0300 [Pedosphaera parvula Ellin514]